MAGHWPHLISDYFSQPTSEASSLGSDTELNSTLVCYHRE
jgi:hypothetical protein